MLFVQEMGGFVFHFRFSFNYQKAPGVIQLKRDIVNKFNGRYNGFYESQKQVLPYNINPWSLYPRH